MVSVVVPVFNLEEYVGKCLESLINQTYRDLQIIVIDDGSTDKSAKIVKDYCSKDKRVEYYYINNQGVSHARNVGLEKVKGDFFCFVDPDDYIEKNTISSLYILMKNDLIDIVCATNFYIDDKERIKKRINHRRIPKGVISSRKAIRYITNRDVYNGIGGFIHTRLLRTKSFRNESGWEVTFDEDIIYGEGTLFLAKCMVKAYNIIFAEGAFYHYVQRSDSSMHSLLRMVENNESLSAYQRIIKLYQENRIPMYDILLMRRFLVYKMLNLANKSISIGYYNNCLELMKIIRENIVPYIITNLSHPSRIAWAIRSYMRIKSETAEYNRKR